MKTAREIAMAYCGERDPFDLELEILRHMEHAIMAERVACAKIADDAADDTVYGSAACAKDIAKAIRSRS